MQIKRYPLGQGNLRFGRRGRHRFSVLVVVFYLAILGAAFYVFLRLDQIRPRVLAAIGPDPTPTPSAQDYAALGEQAYLAGELVTAVGYYQQAAELDPQDVQLLTDLARLLTLTEDPANLQQALAVADQVILLAPDDPRGYAVKARTLDWLGEYDQAVIEALRALELDEEYGLAHAYLAEAYTDQRQLRDARDHAERAVQLEPYHVDTRRNYAYLLEAYGDYSGAIVQYEQALQIHPNLLDLWYGLARNYRGASAQATTAAAADDLFQKSVETYQQIIIRTPNDPRPHVELGRTYFEVRDDTAAQASLERALRLVCEDCPLYNYDEIVEFGYMVPPDRAPEEIYTPAWLRLGNVYHVRRNYEDAIATYEELIAWHTAHDLEVPFEAYLVTASDYYYLDKCDVAIPRAFEALEIYEERRLDEPIALENVLKVIVLCRDYALTPPTIAFEFPDRYEEPDVYLERDGGN